MRYELAKLKAQLKTTMVYVTHDQAEAMTLADKIVVMRNGIIEQVGHPLELYNSPVNTFVAKFIGASEMNIFEISFIEHRGKLSVFKLKTEEQISVWRRDSVDYKSDTKYYLGIRPEDIEILPSGSVFFGNKLDGNVSISENLGGEGIVHLTLKDFSQLTIKTKNTMEVAEHTIKIGFPMDKCYLFDESGRGILGINSANEIYSF
jgi:ABC-type sugar transport system ATPase subunit